MRRFLKHLLIPYSITFLILLPIVFMPFLQKGKSFLWEVDGISQHYPVLIYYGELLRGLFTGRGFPMVDFRIGMGFDTLTTLHYYAIGDPISLLTVFMTKENGVYFYSFLILLRFYLAGVSFLVFCRYWGLKEIAGVLGALMYVFCGYSFFSGIRHPYFMNPMIYLPLLLVGAEQLLCYLTPGSRELISEESMSQGGQPGMSLEAAPEMKSKIPDRFPVFFIIISFITTISNFYFFYMLTMLVVFYITFRYVTVYKKAWKNKLTGFLLTGFKTGGCYLLGVAMAAVVLIPVIYYFLQNSRMDSKAESLHGFLTYDLNYYFNAFLGFFAPGVSPRNAWIDLSFTTLIAVSLTILLLNRSRKHRGLRLAFFLTILGECVPAFGYFMNGFAYVTNRWDFFLAFLVALIFAATYEELFTLTNREKLLLAVGIACYGLFVLIRHRPVTICALLMLLLTYLLILLLQTQGMREKHFLRNSIIYMMVVLSLGYNGYVYYSRGYVDQFYTKEAVVKHLYGAEAAAVEAVKARGEKDFFRIATAGDKVRNEALIHGFYDVSAYFSLIDGNVTDFYKQLELISQRAAIRIDNQDNRTILDTLASVKYYVSDYPSMVPYGYDFLDKFTKASKTYYLYENRYALPLGYTYQDYILREDYDKLSALQKQNALLYAAVLEEKSNYGTKSSQNMDAGLKKLKFTISPDSTILPEDGKIKTSMQENRLLLNIHGAANREIYLRFDNLEIDRREITAQTFQVQAEKERPKNVNVRSKYYMSYFGKKNYLVNTGYNEEERSFIRISFPKREIYSLDKLSVYQLSMEGYREQVEKLRQSSLQNVIQGQNRLEGDITLRDKGITVLSIPYSKGWTAWVDGVKTELLKANIMYSALELSPGSHHIVLTYRTPYLTAGVFVSCLAWVSFAGLIFYSRKKDHIRSAAV